MKPRIPSIEAANLIAIDLAPLLSWCHVRVGGGGPEALASALGEEALPATTVPGTYLPALELFRSLDLADRVGVCAMFLANPKARRCDLERDS
jgi:hypothetical protein